MVKFTFSELLCDVYREGVEKGHIKMERGYYLPSSGNFVPGVLTLGDAFSMRDPASSSGMTVGIQDTIAWRNLFRQIPDLYNYDAMYAATNIFAVERKAYSFANDFFALLFKVMTIPRNGESFLIC